MVTRANKHVTSDTIVSYFSLNFYDVWLKRVFEMLSLTEIKQQTVRVIVLPGVCCHHHGPTNHGDPVLSM